MHRSIPIFVAALAAACLSPGGAVAQDIDKAPRYMLDEVMPGADRFEPDEGDPPVQRAYRGDELLGYVFITSDFPPERYGYSGPIRVLIGMTPEGVLTGVLVTQYHESRMYDWGDFLREPPWFLDQFAGKYVGDRFRIDDDIDGISQATISARALGLSVRDVARRVAAAEAAASGGSTTPTPSFVPEAELLDMSWYDMERRGVAATVVAQEEGKERVRISLVHLASEELGRHLVGRSYEKILEAVERRGGADYELLYVVAGSNPRLSLEKGWSIEQDGRTVAIPAEDLVPFGVPGGVLLGESSYAGVMLLDDDEVDITRPITFVFTGGLSDVGPFRAEYTSQAALATVAETVPSVDPASSSDVAATDPRGTARAATEAATDSAPTPDSAAATLPEPATAAAPEAPPRSATVSEPSDQPIRFDFSVADDDGDDGLLGTVSWPRVGWIVLVLALASMAFFSKSTTLRWTSLLTTFVVLGWIDGGFLSVSHITGLIWVGPSAILSDLPLLIMVAFTVLTTLVWGRVFCGFLCPFGVLQDLIDRIVPDRFKRELPRGLHRAALKAKYVILAAILVPALAGIQVSLYQYFEPFGTVFFLSRSLLLWGIAGAFLLGAAVVPRFYCRYACPLGASLAIGSILSLSRIRRVEQCGYCKVCEHRCPTGAIDGASLDFKECVRCNDCEIQLIERAGVCRHDMEAIRPRLVQLGAVDARAAGTPSAR